MSDDNFYMVVIDGQGPPKKQHKSLREAQTEAERLMIHYGYAKAYILKVIAVGQKANILWDIQ